MTINQVSANALSNPQDKKKLHNALTEISDSLTRIASEKDLIKDIVNNVSEEFKLSKRIVNKMAKTFHKGNFDEESAQHEEFETLYLSLTQTNTNS